MTCCGACHLGGPSPPGHLHAIPDGSYRVKGRAYIQDGELKCVLVDFTLIVVDDVSDLLPASVNNPVVAVEGQLITMLKESYKDDITVCWTQT